MELGQDLIDVTARLQKALAAAHGKLLCADAFVLAGIPQESQHSKLLVGRAMRQLGWERGRYRFDGAPKYGYARGSFLERGNILDVERAEDGGLVVKRRDP